MNRNPRTPQNQSSSDDDAGFLPFGNFDEFDFDEFDPQENVGADDRALIAFLKQHQPIAPPEPTHFEADLMAAIAQEPQSAKVTVRPVSDPQVQRSNRWVQVVGAIAAGLVGAVLGHTLGAWTHPGGMQLADSNPEATAETSPEADLESFLETGWDGAIAQTTSTDSTDSTFGWETTDEM